MSAAVKYTLGRLGLFLVVLAVLLPVPLNFLVKAMIAVVASAGFSYFLLAKWRNEMAEGLGRAAKRRSDEKNRLRAALAGDENAAAAGDRAAGPAQARERVTGPAGGDRGSGPAAAEDRAAGPAAAGDRRADPQTN